MRAIGGFLWRPWSKGTATAGSECHDRWPFFTPARGAMAQEVVFRELCCRGSGCGVMFYICGSCYRGQVYCGDGCRGRMRREQTRRAKRRHQQSREGRLDHRDRQRAYRARLRRRVTDHTSAGSGRSGNIGATWTETVMSTPLAEGFGDRPRFEQSQTAIRIVCIVCGRVGVRKIGQEREKT